MLPNTLSAITGAIKLRSCLRIEFTASGYRERVSIKHPSLYSKARVFKHLLSTYIYQLLLNVSLRCEIRPSTDFEKYSLFLSLSLSLSLIHVLYNCRTCTVVITEFSFQLPQNSIKNDYLSAALPPYSQYESLATRACGSFFIPL